MQIRVFALPMDGDPDAIEEQNRFLRGNRVLSVEKVAVIDHGRHYWSVCVEYLQSRTSNSIAPGASHTADPTKPRIDYREILSKDEFTRFAKLRDLRKRLADTEGVPVYTILTNAQLAQIARTVPQTKTELQQTEGFGTAKVERYGDAVLSLLVTFARREAPVADAAEAPFALPTVERGHETNGLAAAAP